MTESNLYTQRKPKHLQKILAENVLFYRKKFCFSQEELAEMCGYHLTYIGSVERGERNVTIATIEAFASVFGIEPYELLVQKNNE